MKHLSTSHDQLQKETRSLVTALRSPQTRGRWGELQLRRVVEMAGMLERCDFSEQVTSDGDAGRMRPDMVVHLPGGKNVAVDAKVPMQAFLDANEADDESVRRLHLASHGRQMKAHVDALSRKEYWKRVDPSPEFVVAFIPGDPLLTAALEHEPGLMEYAVANHVLLATPTSLIALLRAVAYGWQQEALTDNARQVQVLGAQLYERISVLGDHMAGVGRSLTGAVTAYNKAVGSLEGRVLVTARRFAEMGVVGAGEGELTGPQPVESATRPAAGRRAPGPCPGADGPASGLGIRTRRCSGRPDPGRPIDPVSEAAADRAAGGPFAGRRSAGRRLLRELDARNRYGRVAILRQFQGGSGKNGVAESFRRSSCPWNGAPHRAGSAPGRRRRATA